MKIKLTCPCGASFQAESGTYINQGGTPSYGGKVYLVETLAEQFSQSHQECVHVWRREHEHNAQAAFPVAE